MIATIKNKLLPKLRFREFNHDGVWEETILEKALESISSGLNNSQTLDSFGYKVTRIETISDQTINLGKIGYINTEQDISAYKLKVGDILFSNINSIFHIGKTAIIDRDYNLYHGMNLLRFKINKKLNNPRFIFYLLNTEEIRSSFRERANKAVNQASINQTALAKVPIIKPKIAEQQKIAECLSSLDEMIEAQNQKLQALNRHKKGLMQQLFPSEGQTLPKLRFREFNHDGNWEEIKILNILEESKLYSEKNNPKERITVRLNFKGIEKRNYTGNESDTTVYFIRKKGQFIYGKQNIHKGAFGIIPEELDGFESSQDLPAFDFLPKNCPEYFFYYFCRQPFYSSLEEKMTGTGSKRLNQEVFKNIEILKPLNVNEQQKIAECLSSLDELIEAQNQKLQALNRHKKGLMQQLFPTLSTEINNKV